MYFFGNRLRQRPMTATVVTHPDTNAIRILASIC